LLFQRLQGTLPTGKPNGYDMIIHTRAYPRAGLIGNPSDGYFGKTIAFTFRDFSADVELYQSPELEILPNQRDHSRFENIRELACDVRLNGYYGGIRLLKATVKKFHDYCRENHVLLDDRNFTIRYRSNIPGQVGLAGSSAIILAGLRALMAFYQVSIPKPVQANLALAVEQEELKIPAGLQDRVAQAYQGLVYMDFNRTLLEKQGWGHYEYLEGGKLPPLYIAYRDDLAEGTEVFHGNIRARFEQGDPVILRAMKTWAGLTNRFRVALMSGNTDEMMRLMNANFDLRRRIYRISDSNLEMVEAARSTGACAKFTGSGGAIVGIYRDEPMYKRLKRAMDRLNIRILKPQRVPATGDIP
jgi:glucuronokinase